MLVDIYGYSTKTGALEYTIGGGVSTNGTTVAAASPDGKTFFIAIGLSSTPLTQFGLIDASTGAVIGSFFDVNTSAVSAIFSNDSAKLYVLCSSSSTGVGSPSVEVYNVDTVKGLTSVTTVTTTLTGTLSNGVMSGDDSTLYVSQYTISDPCYAINTTSFAVTAMPIQLYGANTFAVSADGNTIYASIGGVNAPVYVYDIATQAVTSFGSYTDIEQIYCSGYDPNLLYFGDINNNLQQIDISTGVATVLQSNFYYNISAILSTASPQSISPSGTTSVTGTTDGTDPFILGGMFYAILPSDSFSYDFNIDVSAACAMSVTALLFGSGSNTGFSNPRLTGAINSATSWSSSGASNANLVLPSSSPGIMAVSLANQQNVSVSTGAIYGPIGGSGIWLSSSVTGEVNVLSTANPESSALTFGDLGVIIPQ